MLHKNGAAVTFGIESANIVGYQDVPIANQQFSLFAPTFKGVGGALDLQNVKVVNADGTPADYFAVVLQTMDENNAFDGETCATYTWDGTGWLDAEFSPIEAGNKLIKTGDAFLVGNNIGEGLSFQVSGEVDLVNKNLISDAQFSLCGNSTPVSFDLTDVQIINKDGTPADYFAVVLQTMDENNAFDGETCATYTWDGTGWLNSEFAPIEKGAVNVQPGNAFLVGNNMGVELFFKVPSPIK
jgi:hypothetical protein